MTNPVDNDPIGSVDSERVVRKTEQQLAREERIRNMFNLGRIPVNQNNRVVLAECKLCAALVDIQTGLTIHVGWHDDIQARLARGRF